MPALTCNATLSCKITISRTYPIPEFPIKHQSADQSVYMRPFYYQVCMRLANILHGKDCKLMSMRISTEQQSIVCKYATMFSHVCSMHINFDVIINHMYCTAIITQDCLNDAIASQA